MENAESTFHRFYVAAAYSDDMVWHECVDVIDLGDVDSARQSESLPSYAAGSHLDMTCVIYIWVIRRIIDHRIVESKFWSNPGNWAADVAV